MKKVIVVVVVLVLVGIGTYVIYQQFFAKAPSTPVVSKEPGAPEAPLPPGANAQDFFVKAGNLFPSSKKISDVTVTANNILKSMDYAAAQNLLPQISQCEPVFAELKNAVNAEVNIGPADFRPERKIPNLLRAQMTTKLLAVKGMALENQGKLNEAVDTYLLAAQYGSTFPGKNTSLIQQLIGFALEKIAYRPLKQFVLNHPEDVNDLKRIIETLEKVEQKRVPISESFKSEQKCFAYTLKNKNEYAKKDEELAKLSDAEVQQILTDAEKIWAYQITAVEMPYSELKKELVVSEHDIIDTKLQEMVTTAHPFLKAYLLNIAAPKIRELSSATENRLVRVIAALQLYYDEKKAYPNSLSELTPTYFTAVPKDYFSDSDFVYGLVNQTFYLYSVGPDIQDNQERPVYDPTNGTISRGDIIGTLANK